MSKEIIVDVNPFQTRVVLLNGGTPEEVYIERHGKERLVGNIYAGRVQNVLPGMQAAFVDIGLERNSFLFAGDIFVDRSDFVFAGGVSDMRLEQQSIRDMVKPGQQIMCQVTKEPVGTKGARITTHITLPGRTLVLMPTVNYVGVSRRIESETERTRLKELLEQIKPDGMGVIVRTAAEGRSREDFEADLSSLLELWGEIQKRGAVLTAPTLIHTEEPLISRTIRDLFTADIERLVINNREFYEKVLSVTLKLNPALACRVHLFEDVPDMFDQRGIETALDKALSRKVWMKNGGYIIIDQTEALTTIDVNTGKYVGTDNLQETITRTNCEAAKEIARQLRLRDVSGIIIIDFIDMDEIADKERVLKTLREELRKDRTKSNVLGITQLGLVEMTRKKVRPCIANTLQTPCPYCGGGGKVLSPEAVLLKVRKKLMLAMAEEPGVDYLLKVHPSVAELLQEHSSEQDPILPHTQDRAVYVMPESSIHAHEFSIVPLRTGAEVAAVQTEAKKY